MTTRTADVSGRGLFHRCRARAVRAGMVGIAATIVATAAAAGTVRVPAGEEALQAAVDAAAVGDVLVLEPGVHLGPVTVSRPLTLHGESGAVVDGRSRGPVIMVKAPDVTVRNLVVQNSGTDRERIASGIHLDRAAHRAVIEGCRFRLKAATVSDAKAASVPIASRPAFRFEGGHRSDMKPATLPP